MAFNCTALVSLVCFVLLAVSFSTAMTVQEWGENSAYNVKVYDDKEWHPSKQYGIREAKFNFPTYVSPDEHFIKTFVQLDHF